MTAESPPPNPGVSAAVALPAHAYGAPHARGQRRPDRHPDQHHDRERRQFLEGIATPMKKNDPPHSTERTSNIAQSRPFMLVPRVAMSRPIAGWLGLASRKLRPKGQARLMWSGKSFPGGGRGPGPAQAGLRCEDAGIVARLASTRPGMAAESLRLLDPGLRRGTRMRFR